MAREMTDEVARTFCRRRCFRAVLEVTICRSVCQQGDAASFSFSKKNNPSNSILKPLTCLSFHGKMNLSVRAVESC
jgi:hypothetical protein